MTDRRQVEALVLGNGLKSKIFSMSLRSLIGAFSNEKLIAKDAGSGQAWHFMRQVYRI